MLECDTEGEKGGERGMSMRYTSKGQKKTTQDSTPLRAQAQPRPGGTKGLSRSNPEEENSGSEKRKTKENATKGVTICQTCEQNQHPTVFTEGKRAPDALTARFKSKRGGRENRAILYSGPQGIR